MDKDDVRSHRGKGVPLEGPFLGHFSQGILGEMNENTHFSDFRIFCFFELLFLRISTPTTPNHEKTQMDSLKEAIQRLIKPELNQTKHASNEDVEWLGVSGRIPSNLL